MPALNFKKILAHLPTAPGIYQMLDADKNTLYVGKARNLKKRVASYFQRTLADTKTQSLVDQIDDVIVTITNNENEALLLENTLIKELKPRYNILFRDDKSYPYLFLSSHSDFPRLDIHRGAQKEEGRYFGPFPNVGGIRDTLTLLQKIFKIRQCTDHFFKLRTRPCLQYFIKRCTAPCVGYVDVETYQRNVHFAVLFLEGKNAQVIDELAEKMDEASVRLDYEEAARYRDQIAVLRRLQEKQFVMGNAGDADVIAVDMQDQHVCFQMLYIRDGRLMGNKSYFVEMSAQVSREEALSTFLPQYYLDKTRHDMLPKRILVNVKLEEKDWIASALSEQLGKKIEILDAVRGKQRKWLQLAMTNAKHALAQHLADKVNYYQRFVVLQSSLQLPNIPQRIECFDVSHTMGEATVASCVVFDRNGAVKKDYRRFNIKDVTPGDDYAALAQALTRHYKRLKESEGKLPDLLMIDGGKGQLKIAQSILEELQISSVILLAVAKGVSRKPGLETLHIAGREQAIHLQENSTALHLIQQIRDEAHRFAIVGHRKQRAKSRSKSFLENVPGIGPKRRKELLRQFGGLQEIKRASVDDIAKVPGISRELAERIFKMVRG